MKKTYHPSLSTESLVAAARTGKISPALKGELFRLQPRLSERHIEALAAATRLNAGQVMQNLRLAAGLFQPHLNAAENLRELAGAAQGAAH